jgi:hypothetical protein
MNRFRLSIHEVHTGDVPCFDLTLCISDGVYDGHILWRCCQRFKIYVPLNTLLSPSVVLFAMSLP